MSGETWVTPVELGVVGVGTTDWNNIQKNLSVLHRGNGVATIETAVGSNNLVLPNETDETFFVSGDGADIKYIDTTNRQPGNRIQLIKTGPGSNIISPGEGDPDEGFKPIVMYDSGLLTPGMRTAPLEMPEGMLITLVFAGDNWHCTV
jgi:hypothetical protein